MKAEHLTRWKQDRGDYTLNPKFFQKILKKGNNPDHRYVLLPRECKTTKICNSISPPPEFQGGCDELHVRGSGEKIRKSTMKDNLTMANKIIFKQKPSVPNDMSNVGFKSVVAPINQNVQPRDKTVNKSCRIRHVSELLGASNASTKVTPGFSDCFMFFWNNKKLGMNKFVLQSNNWDPKKDMTSLSKSCTSYFKTRE